LFQIFCTKHYNNKQQTKMQLKSLFVFALLCCGLASAQLGIGVNVDGSVGVGVGGGVSVGGSLGGVVQVSVDSVVAASGYVSSLLCTAGSTLTVGSGVQLTCGNVQLAGGRIAMTDSYSGESVTVQGPCTVSAGTNGNSVSGGVFSTTGSGYIDMTQSGSQLTITSTALSPCVAHLGSSSVLSLHSVAVTAASTVSGSSSSLVKIENGATICNAHTVFAAPTHVYSGGELRSTASGAVVVADNTELTLRGGKLTCSSPYTSAAASAANVVVGSASGAAVLACRGSTTSAHNGVVALNGASQMIVEQGSTYQCTAASAITATSSTAKVVVAGTLSHQAAYTSNCAHTITGTHIINSAAANSCSFGALTYGSASQVIMQAHPTNGFTTANVAGHSTMAGALHLTCGSYRPPSAVNLVKAGSCSGTFSSVTSDSSSIKGQIHYTPTGCVWYPYATGACTSCTHVY